MTGLVAASTFSTVVAIMLSAFFTGALARFAVPGPDPMPAWLTIAIGLVGSVVGAVVGAALSGGNGFVISFASLGTAILLVIAYRRFVQQRPITGPDALRPPRRGIGIEHYRERLRKAGLDPDKTLVEQVAARQGAAAPPGRPSDETQELLAKLLDLHRANLLTDEELNEKRAQLLAR
ncbi:MAG: hypothetical protein QOG81_615 [Gaiellaceae bacterium]|jgi:uncharacterized membrane protein YeaQ/YmgE (transglycosylase-associated protein family)|nr:hypothetical protein [Gaiellaceae bacterium]